MRQHLASILIATCLVTLSWAQGTKEPFDVKRSQQELEVMRGILSTTLSFVAESQRTKSTSSKRTGVSTWRFSNLNAFYLAGQGAVFVIPTSSLRMWNFTGVSADFGREFSDAYAQEIQAQEMALQAADNVRVAVGRAGQGFGAAAPAVPAPPPPPASTATPAPAPAPTPAPPQVNREELRKRVEELQAKAKKSREEAEANREKFLQNVAEIKGYLIEAVANYGDSLTTVKPTEYINLVLMTDLTLFNDFTTDVKPLGSQVISVQKSWITDYKMGRLTLDGFKQKVLQYSE